MKLAIRTLMAGSAMGCAVLLACSLATAQAAPAAPAAAPATSSSEFPAGPGRNTFLRVCSQCHSPTEVESNRQDSDGWAATLNQMIQNGAQGTNSDFSAIYQYLTTYFNTTPAPAAATAASGSGTQAATSAAPPAQAPAAKPTLAELKTMFPDGAGKNTFLTVCSECHSPARVIKHPEAARDWGFLVNAMRKRGAKGTDADFTAITAYLNTILPKEPATINVNTATAVQLQAWLKLPQTEAEAIVSYRKANGNFTSIEQVEQVPGVTAATIEAAEAKLSTT